VQGNLKALVQLAREGGVDYVYIALPMAGEAQVKALIHDLSDTTASVFFVPDFFVFEMLQARWTEIDGMPLVSGPSGSTETCGSPLHSKVRMRSRWITATITRSSYGTNA